ncbi:uncharacterized protein [Cherax quadricarinatus]|uniref:uncharacterized protein n=1 Tax=Cherax quadricarinatus TaxID=27406 RepID=UPI00387E8F5E
MWKVILLMISASVIVQLTEAQSGAESLSFHGYIPGETIRAKAPRGDGQPNDIYLVFENPPALKDGEVVIYPRNTDGLGLEYGQDPEERVYQIHNTNKRQFNKHNKHSHDQNKSSGKKFKRAATVLDTVVH